ncbi:MAG: hypothetical protein IT361_03970 [Gemmatimonadaceae bacterium]|nr:hypothetical protein [Gemmatimonadaceae bacterium]
MTDHTVVRAGHLSRAWLLAACIGAGFLPAVLLGQSEKGAGKGKKDDKPMTAADSARAEEEKRIDRARKAASRALFASTDPVEFTLIANYGAISRDRDTLSTKRFDGVVVVKDSSGADRRIPVRLRTRGHFRLMARNCRFVPLRIDFPDSGLKDTPFAGQKGIKLGTHCQNNDDRYDEYTRREYLAYSLFNAVTDQSFRARLAMANYVDSASGKSVARRVALFIESENDVGRRLQANVREMRGALFDDLDLDQLMNVSFFEYAIGNTDFSIYSLHNIRVAATTTGRVIPLAYDFDFSGLVGAHYATPDPRMGLRSVRERRYRGPCRPIEAYQAAAARFIAKKPAMFAAIEAVPGFSRDEQNNARSYLQDFFSVIENPGRLKRELFDQCEKKAGV